MPSLLARISKGVSHVMSGPTVNEPRKGVASPSVSNVERGYLDGDRVVRPSLLAVSNLRALAERDDVIVSIRRVLRNSIGELKWKIVPDIVAIESDIKRWKSTVEINLAMRGEMKMHFEPQAMSREFFEGATGILQNLLVEEAQEEDADFATSHRLHAFFENILAAHNVIAESHVAPVQQLFEQPNSSDTYRSFMDQIVDSLTLYDAAAIVKNPMLEEDRIGEIYLIPGEDVRIYRRADRQQPFAPDIAYDWSTNDKILAFYNALELCYITANPQSNGYGRPPLEALVSAMLASLSSDEYLLDFFMNNNVPAGIFDLGPNVDQGERDAVEKQWNNDIRKGLRRIKFVSNMEGVKGFMPMPSPTMRDNEQIALFDMWVKRKTGVFGLSPNDIGHTQDMHLANSEQQATLTQARGIDSLARIIENHLNTSIVKGTMWRRTDPLNVKDMTGRPLPVFPFKDVRFEFVTGERDEDNDTSTRDKTYFDMGVLSINEIRKHRGMPAIPGGDEHVVTQQIIMRVEDFPQIPVPTQQDETQRLPDGRVHEEPENEQQNQEQQPENERPRPQLPSQSSPEETEKHLTGLAEKLAALVTKGTSHGSKHVDGKQRRRRNTKRNGNSESA